ncbi:pyocin knob domain-containing S74 family peptidase [Rahnella inusitata]|uniref:Tail fiber domain-containing protein n=1 Tax=Rahnella inusitata TaxID=58169 RepID=A0ABX9NYR1_9GAMM|nr:pyocin knob domain-containing S74 family peptidase [Rahnella inusitata]RJT12790.1 tail fiber domain-containing protein [Rahnella inusitata]
MAWYKTGTVAVAATKVTGTGTNFLDAKFGIGPGQAFLLPASGTVKIYEIASVEDATHLTLTTSAGTVAAGAAYAVMSFYTDSIPDFSKRLAAQLGYYQSQMDGWQTIMTGTGTVSVTAPDNTVVNISSFSKLTSDIAKAYTDGGLLNATVTPNSLGNVTDFNIYYQTANANAIVANGYPIAKAGTLYVTKSAYGCQQMYITFQGEAFVRGLTGAFTPAAPNWSDWWPIFTGKSTIPVGNGGTGAATAAAARTALGAAPTVAPVFTGGVTLNGTVAIEGTQLNLRASASSGGWPFFVTFMAGQGNNLAYSRIYSENSGDLTMATAVNGSPKYFQHTASGDLLVPRNIQCVSLTQTSDRDKKDFITPILNALDKINAIDGVTFTWKTDGTPSAGVIAQDLMKVLPEAIGSTFDENDEYGTEEQQVEKEVMDEEGNTTSVTETVSVTKLVRKRDESKRSYTVEYNGVIALAVQAIKELSEKVAVMEAYIGPENLAAMSKEHTT